MTLGTIPMTISSLREGGYLITNLSMEIRGLVSHPVLLNQSFQMFSKTPGHDTSPMNLLLQSTTPPGMTLTSVGNMLLQLIYLLQGVGHGDIGIPLLIQLILTLALNFWIEHVLIVKEFTLLIVTRLKYFPGHRKSPMHFHQLQPMLLPWMIILCDQCRSLQIQGHLPFITESMTMFVPGHLRFHNRKLPHGETEMMNALSIFLIGETFMLMILSAPLVYTNRSPWNILCNVHLLQKLSLIRPGPGFTMKSIGMDSLVLGYQWHIMIVDLGWIIAQHLPMDMQHMKTRIGP